MRLVEVSTSYLVELKAAIVTTDRRLLQPRSKTREPVQCSPSRVAESQGFERADYGYWESYLVDDQCS